MKNSKETRLVPSLPRLIAVAAILIAVVILFFTIIGPTDGAVDVTDANAGVGCEIFCALEDSNPSRIR